MERGDEPVPRDEALGVLPPGGAAARCRSSPSPTRADGPRAMPRPAGPGRPPAGAGGAGRVQPLAGVALGARVAARRFERRGARGRRAPSRRGSPRRCPSRRCPTASACSYIGAALAELLRCLGGIEGAMTHDRCRARGDAALRLAVGGSGGIPMKVATLDRTALAAALDVAGADGWLLYDFQGVNPVLGQVLGHRRHGAAGGCSCYLPRDGEPVAVAHRIELQSVAGFPGTVLPYSRWEELHAALRQRGGRQAAVAMEVAAERCGAVPRPGAERRGAAAHRSSGRRWCPRRRW